MGARHDGEADSTIPFCNFTDSAPNYIMAPFASRVPLKFVWSNCSKMSFSKFLK